MALARKKGSQDVYVYLITRRHAACCVLLLAGVQQRCASVSEYSNVYGEVVTIKFNLYR
jgi:hypothetical protein